MESINLSGPWQYTLDPMDTGIPLKGSGPDVNQTIPLPGSLPEHGVGNPPSVDSPWVGMIGRIQDGEWLKPKYRPYRESGNFKMPFWLQPPAVYVGAAWYTKEVEVPADWEGTYIALYLERPHWETQVWVDDSFVSTRNSLSVPHVFDLSARLTPGRHRISVRVDNRMIVDVGKNSHSISDHTQGNWNGIVGRMELMASQPERIENTQIFTDIHTRSIRVTVTFSGLKLNQSLKWTVVGEGIDPMQGEVPISPGMACSFEVQLGQEAMLWDEFSPNLYTLNLKLGGDTHSTRFGLREFRQKGKQFAINGRHVLLRGTLDCCAFPLTGYPPVDHSSWRKIFKACKDHGLNHVRFHSWCPPEAAFDVADEMGIYLQVECAAWANQDSSLGDGRTVDAWLYEEGKRIVETYGNHPSFVMMAYGNEPGGDHREEYLTQWVTYWKEHDPRRVHTSGAGWPELEVNDFQNIPDPRIQRWGEGLKSRINGHPPETVADYREFVDDRSVPIISHEIGQWCVYPNFREMVKYTGVMKPRNFEVFQELLQRAGLSDQADDFLMASGKLQVLAYKEEIEASLRTEGFGGFQLLGLNDFPGQGTAPVGVLDVFWESKPYLSAREFSRFCGPVTPLARLPKRVFTPQESLKAGIEIANYGPVDLQAATVNWEVLDSRSQPLGSPLEGRTQMDIPKSGCFSVMEIDVPLNRVVTPVQLKLRVWIEDQPADNDWDIWVFSGNTEFPDDPRIIHRWDDQAAARLEEGETLWLMADPDDVRTDVSLGFSPIFWNTAWTNGQDPHTLGILCDPGHPALSEFPTEFHSNWHWWYLISKAAPMILPAESAPIVQVVPDWFNPRCLGLIFEASVGSGKLLVSSIRLEQGGPVGHQMAATLAAYLNSPEFRPDLTIDTAAVSDIFIQP